MHYDADVDRKILVCFKNLDFHQMCQTFHSSTSEIWKISSTSYYIYIYIYIYTHTCIDYN